MVNEVSSSDPVDPFADYSALSLFPQTFKESTHHLDSSDANNIDSLHSCLKSMALRSPNKLLEQAKIIVDCGSELTNVKYPSHIASEEKNEAVAAKDKGIPQERRPGLGRKRARFSMKPSQPTVNLEPSLNIDILQDPEEYFAAFERLDNANKELRRQRGGALKESGALKELNQNSISTTARNRRPGILGRKPASYKHLYPTVPSNNDDTFISSQEISEEEIIVPSNYSSPQETIVPNPNLALSERELDGSITKAENKVNELFDELLSGDTEDLDEDRALTLLRERLQIKPIVIDKLCLPDLKDIHKVDLKVSSGNLPKPRNTLSKIHFNLNTINTKTPVKDSREEAESSVYPIASPTPLKSPLASISLLKRRISQSNPSHDPFSALDIDASPAIDSSPAGHIDEQTNQVVMEKELGSSANLKSLIGDEDDFAVTNMGSCTVVANDSTLPFDTCVNDNSSKPEMDVDVLSDGSHVDFMANVGGSNMNEGIIDDNSRCDANINDLRNGPHNLDDEAADILQEAVASAQPDVNMEDSTLEKLNNSLRKLDQSTYASTGRDMDGQAENPDTGSEQHIEKIQESSNDQSQEKTSPSQKPRKGGKAATRVCKEPKRKRSSGSQEQTPPSQRPKEGSKAAPRVRKEPKRNKNSRRQSLAGAGMLWESGVRRSTRIKMRPLEYWKGERFLYGRIHQSLSTVIGVKYVSPAKGGDGKPSLKVKSYVSDEHKELVELAALH